MTDACLRDFTSTTGWVPERTATFAGMLAWTQYDVFTRVLMKLILPKQRLPPEQLDTSHDVDCTDCEAVERFGTEFARSLDGAAPTAWRPVSSSGGTGVCLIGPEGTCGAVCGVRRSG